MFDDFKLRKCKFQPIKPAPQMFQKLPNLRPNSKNLPSQVPNPPFKEFFSEFSVLNQLPFQNSKPTQSPLTQNNVIKSFANNPKIRSVSFVDFSETLTKVSRISKIEDKYSNYNGLLRKLLKSKNINYKEKKILDSIPPKQRKEFNIFNYPNLKINDIRDKNTDKDKRNGYSELVIDNTLMVETKKEAIKPISQIPLNNCERARSTEVNQKALSKKIMPLIKKKDDFNLIYNQNNERNLVKMGSYAKQVNERKNTVSKTKSKENNLSISDEENLLEPWKIQDTLSDISI